MSKEGKKPFCVKGGECIGNVPTIETLSEYISAWKECSYIKDSGWLTDGEWNDIDLPTEFGIDEDDYLYLLKVEFNSKNVNDYFQLLGSAFVFTIPTVIINKTVSWSGIFRSRTDGHIKCGIYTVAGANTIVFEVKMYKLVIVT